MQIQEMIYHAVVMLIAISNIIQYITISNAIAFEGKITKERNPRKAEIVIHGQQDQSGVAQDVK